MKKTILFILLVICSNAWAGGNKEKQDNWAGIYIGVIPAADCPGIAVVAILNDEGKYKITYQYIDRDEAVLTFTGAFTWDEKAKTITLNSKALPPHYKVKGDTLIQLDMEGKEISGKLADNYVLRKVKFPSP